MSIRSNRTDDSYASAVRRDLGQLKTTALEANRLDQMDTSVRPETTEAAAAYDALAVHEQAAASLGVHPDALKPISFMNAGATQPCSKASHVCSLHTSQPFPTFHPQAITKTSARATPCPTTSLAVSRCVFPWLDCAT